MDSTTSPDLIAAVSDATAYSKASQQQLSVSHEELKKLLEESLALNKKNTEINLKVERYMQWALFMNLLKLLILVLAFIAAGIYIPTLVRQFFEFWSIHLSDPNALLELIQSLPST